MIDFLSIGVLDFVTDVASYIWLFFSGLGTLSLHSVRGVLSSVDFYVDNPFNDFTWRVEYDLYSNIFTGSFSTVSTWITDNLGISYMPFYQALLYVSLCFFAVKVLVSWLSFLRY